MAYYAVIFTSQLSPNAAGYEQASEVMLERVSQMPGFLGFDSARGSDGKGITVSYWDSVDALKAWGRDPEHREIQERGRREWYQDFRIRIGLVDEEY
ncbi:MAG: antibiotic biosynthesis monooxygenase family protein [Bdellovibrionota bacterium]